VERIYPEFPDEEYEIRLKKAKEAMEEHGIDALLIAQKENVEYFSGFMTSHWNVKGFCPGTVILPREGEPVLVIPEFLRGTAERTSWIRNMKRHERTHSNPRDFPNLVTKTIKEMELESGVIGIETGEELHINMPIVDMDKIRVDLPKAKFVSGADIIWECRMIKSPLEIERLKKATLINCKAYERARELVKEGMTEIEIADIFRKTMIEEGSKLHPEHAFFNIRAGKERYPMADTLCQERRIKKGEMLVLDCGCTYKGYWSDLCRVAHVGKPTSEHKRIYRTVVEAVNAAVDRLRPGIKAEEVYDIAHRIIEEAKYGVTLDMVGHGIGLDVHEPPVLGLGIDMTLKPGMVLCVEPWIYDVFDKGIFACEDMFVITEKKCELLSPLPREELWIVE